MNAQNEPSAKAVQGSRRRAPSVPDRARQPGITSPLIELFSQEMIKRIAVVVLALAGLVVPEGADARGPCTREKARQQIVTFIGAYNRGDLNTLDRVFAPGDRFQEYRVMPLERPPPFSEDRSSLLNYFAERHSYNDHIELLDLDVGRDRNTGGFYTLLSFERTSDDPAPWGEGRFEPRKSGVNSRCEIRLLRFEWSGP